MIDAVLWWTNFAAVAVIFVAGVRVIVERSLSAPMWVRAANAAMVIGALFSVDRPAIDLSQVMLTAGLAGTLIFRLVRKAAGKLA